MSRDGLAGLERHQFAGAFSDRLDDKRDGPRVRVGIGDGERDSLRAFLQADDDKLAGLADPGNARRQNVQSRDVRAELSSGQNGVHLGASRVRPGRDSIVAVARCGIHRSQVNTDSMNNIGRRTPGRVS